MSFYNLKRVAKNNISRKFIIYSKKRFKLKHIDTKNENYSLCKIAMPDEDCSCDLSTGFIFFPLNDDSK